ncbi:MAG: glycosyltransferase family 4 protein [Gemmatimonadales bacterium]
MTTTTALRILVVHNRYREPGGEDAVVAAETALLRRHGHTVVEYVDDNRRIDSLGPLAAATQTVWSRPTRRRLRALLREQTIDVAHVHNTLFLVSPSAYSACRDAGVPVVQTVHNYRLACAAATFYRAGRPCEDCLGRAPWPGILHACYRENRALTALVATTVTVHRWLGTWRSAVDLYVATTDFQRQKLVSTGLPEERIVVKPHFVDPDPGESGRKGGYALYVGRLAPEKGLGTLLDGWARLPDIPLKVAGDGPLADGARARLAERGQSNVELVGRVSRDGVFELLRQARLLVFPSECYETFGMAIVEAFACGVPVVASRLGAMAEIVADGRTGLLFRPGDPDDLGRAVRRLWDDPALAARLGRGARVEYDGRYTAERNYHALMNCYRRVVEGIRTR